MVITDDFVYIHLPKTGGTFVEHALQRLLDELGAWYIDTSRDHDRAVVGTKNKHETVRQIPPDHQGKPVLFTIRNPYDWYVSQYEFAWWKVEPEREFDDRAVRERYASYPDFSFEEFVRAINDWRLWPARDRDNTAPVEREGRIGVFTSQFVRFLAPSPSAAFAAAGAQGSRGLSAALYPQIDFLRTDRLNRELHDYLVAKGFPGRSVEFVLGARRIGRQGSRMPLAPGEQVELDEKDTPEAAGGRAGGYYDEATRTFVRQKECLLFELFPEFEDGAPAYETGSG